MSLSMNVIEIERRVFEQIERRLLRNHRGEWLCVKGEETVGPFPTQHEAMDAAIKKWEPGLVFAFRIGDKPERVRELRPMVAPLAG